LAGFGDLEQTSGTVPARVEKAAELAVIAACEHDRNPGNFDGDHRSRFAKLALERDYLGHPRKELLAFAREMVGRNVVKRRNLADLRTVEGFDLEAGGESSNQRELGGVLHGRNPLD
jgi:hypothetical protein